MASASSIVNQVDTLVLARLQGGGIKRYSLEDGRSIEKDSVSDLLELRRLYNDVATQEADGSLLAGFRLFSP